MDRDRKALDEYVAAQHGLFTLAQARACGCTLAHVNRKRREGDWVDVRKHVFAHRGLDLTPKVRDVAVQLAVPQAVLAGPSAARWHGVDVPSTATCVVLEPGQHSRPREVTIFREPIPERDLCQVDGVFLTTLDRALFDCMRVLPDAAALALVDQGLQLGWTSLSQLAERISGFTSRHGAPRLVGLLRNAARASHSASAQLAKRLLQRAGIWGWLEDVPITDRWGFICIGDIVFSGPMLLIELDGRVYDTDGQRARRERDRHNRLLAAGWTVLFFCWYELSSLPDQVVATIRMSLDKLGAHAR
jgi:hypothetical protein